MGRASRANPGSRENWPNRPPKEPKPKTRIKQLRERALQDRIKRMIPQPEVNETAREDD